MTRGDDLQGDADENKVSGNGKAGGGVSTATSSSSSEGTSVELFSNWSEFVQFLKETWEEFRKISWPSRHQVIQETWSVIVLVSILTVLVLGFDWAVAKTVFEPLDKFAKKMGGGIGRVSQSSTPAQDSQPSPANNGPNPPATNPPAPASPASAPATNPPTPASQSTSPASKPAAIPPSAPVGKLNQTLPPASPSGSQSGNTDSTKPAGQSGNSK